MKRRIKKIIFWGCLGAIFYVLLSNHFIFFGRTVKVLKKSRLSLNYTFFSTQGRTNQSILSIDDLREDGIADLLVDMGRMTETQRATLMERYKEESEESY